VDEEDLRAAKAVCPPPLVANIEDEGKVLVPLVYMPTGMSIVTTVSNGSEPVLPTPPARAVHEALQFFCDDLLQDVPVQAQVRHQALQLRVSAVAD
jgi:hypothetical protein